jgi:WD40 repeat protein
MKTWMTTLLVLTGLLTAGCPHHVPLTEEHSIPIDQELIGYWHCFESKADLKAAAVLVMPFSKTEYVIQCINEENGDESFFLRGYPTETGGVRCMQLQWIGPRNIDPSDPYDENSQSNRYAVVKYEIKDDTLKLYWLNGELVSDKAITSEALREAFLENLDHEELFVEVAKFRDSGVHADKRQQLAPEITVADKSLTTTASANPVYPEIAVLTTNGAIRVYDYSGQIVRSLEPDERTIKAALCYSNDGKQLLAGTRSGDLLVWHRDSKIWKPLAEKVADKVSRVAWLGDNVVWSKYVSYYGKDYTPINRDKPSGGVYEPVSGQAEWAFQSAGRQLSMNASPDGKQLAVINYANHAKELTPCILNGETGKEQATLANPRNKEHRSYGPRCVCIGPDNNTVAVGYGSYIGIWNAKEEKLCRLLKGVTNGVHSLAFSPDGCFLISGTGYGAARIWSVAKGIEIGRIRIPTNKDIIPHIESVGFAPDGKKAYALAKGRLTIVETPKSPNTPK